MTLTDVVIPHEYKGKNAHRGEKYIVDPFQNSRGPNAGKYEILRYVERSGPKRKKRSAHVTEVELAELYARGLINDGDIRIRVRPVTNNYPTSPLGKTVPRHCITAGSAFGTLVEKVDIGLPVSENLRQELSGIGISIR